VRTHRSATAFAFGARIGVLINLTPSELTIWSKEPENLASRSCSRKRTFTNRSSIARLRACWHNQAQSGLAVTPARCTRRDPSSIEKSTYSVRRETVSTAKKSQASTPCAWARGNSLHDGPPRREPARDRGVSGSF
jgi:hypothetical protein